MKPIDVDALTAIAKAEQTRTLSVCERVSYLIDLKFNYQRMYGKYAGPEVDGMLAYHHWWNVAADGTIIDATANQFSGEGKNAPPVRIIPADDIRQSWYVKIKSARAFTQ